MTRREQKNLVAALNTLLVLYVKPEDRRQFAKAVAEHMQIAFVDRFIEACLAD